MANSKYEYVKEFENDLKLPLYNWIVVKIDGCHFHRFSADHTFDKPNDENALNLMNSCAAAMLQHFPDIVFAYGVSDEYSFIWKETTRFYQRRECKIVSLSVSYFTSVYVMKWKEFFPHKELKEPPYFHGRVLCYPRVQIVRGYLAWRQVDCHINNQYNTCFWMLVKSGKTEREAQEFLKGTRSKDKNELLFQQFEINYDKLPAMFRKGSCVFRDKVEETVKLDESGHPVRRKRMKVSAGHFDLIGPNFWSEHPYILHEELQLSSTVCFGMANSKYEYLKEFENDLKLPLYNWIVVRIDGCHFHRFSADHTFDKPNDENALNLMNSCAAAMLQHFPDIVFAYGVSDEYSFIWKETTRFCQRQECDIISLSVSYFTSVYVLKWKEFFPHKELKEPPYFDGRVVCYPRVQIVRDYLAWRQVDCHINNQYNTCFWMLVKSGKTEREAQEFLKGTQSKDKNELLFQQFEINYDKLPAMFRKGSCVFRDEVEETVKLDLDEGGNPVRRKRMEVTVGHSDIIGPDFWSEHPYLLHDELQLSSTVSSLHRPSSCISCRELCL